MIINESKPKEPERVSNKEKLLAEFMDMSEDLCSLAYFYVKGYEMGGIDVTKVWEQIPRNMDALNRAYHKGFNDGIEFLQKKIEEKERNGTESNNRQTG